MAMPENRALVLREVGRETEILWDDGTIGRIQSYAIDSFVWTGKNIKKQLQEFCKLIEEQ